TDRLLPACGGSAGTPDPPQPVARPGERREFDRQFEQRQIRIQGIDLRRLQSRWPEEFLVGAHAPGTADAGPVQPACASRDASLPALREKRCQGAVIPGEYTWIAEVVDADMRQPAMRLAGDDHVAGVLPRGVLAAS